MAQRSGIFPDLSVDSFLSREYRLRAIIRILLWGAIIHGALAAGFMLVNLIGISGNNALLAAPHSIFLSGFTGSDAMALIMLVTLILANISILVLLVVGASAQEFWIIPVSFLAMLINAGLLILIGFLPALLTIGILAIASLLIFRNREAFRINPVMIKELRGRMRGIRAFAIITLYLALMSAFTILLYLIDPLNSVLGTAVTGELGRVLFIGMISIELLLITFIVPALTSGAVAGERERKTFDLLQTTLLSPASFIVGKLESALGYIFLLLLSAIPLQSIAFLFGGVSETELALAFFVLMIVALTLGAVGLFFSSQTDRSLTATARSYASALSVAFIAPLIVSAILGNAFGNAINGVARGMAGSKLLEIGALYLDMIAVSLNPLTALQFAQEILIDHRQLFFVNITLESGGQIPVISPWILLVILYSIIAALLLMRAIQRMNRLEE